MVNSGVTIDNQVTNCNQSFEIIDHRWYDINCKRLLKYIEWLEEMILLPYNVLINVWRVYRST